MPTNTLAEPGPFDPTEKMAPDEPMFTLAGHDPDAPETVHFWVGLRRKRALAMDDADAARAELIQCTDAEMIAFEMQRWRKGLPAEDTSAVKRASYSGHTATEAVRAEIALKELVGAGLAHLREAAYHIGEAHTKLGKAGVLEPGDMIALLEHMEAINAIAHAHAPKRPDFRVERTLPLEAPKAGD